MKFKEIGTKNLRHVWSVLCSNSVLNADNNNLSLNNLVEQLTIPITKEMSAGKEKQNATGYLISLELEIVSRFKKSADEAVAFEVKLDFLNPKGVVLASPAANSFGIKKDIKNMRVRSKLTNLPIDQSGEFTFVVQVKEAGEGDFTEVDRIPLEIILKEEK